MHVRKAAHLALNVLHNSAVTNTKDSSFAGTMTSNAAPFGSGCWVIVVSYPFLRISAAKDCGSVTAPRSGSLRLSDSILAHSPWRAMRNHCSFAWSGVPASDASKRMNFSGCNFADMGSFSLVVQPSRMHVVVLAASGRAVRLRGMEFFMGPNVRAGANGRTPGPGWRKCTAYRQTGPGGLPLALRLSEGLGRRRVTECAQHRVDTGLIARALGLEPFDDILIDS